MAFITTPFLPTTHTAPLSTTSFLHRPCVAAPKTPCRPRRIQPRCSDMGVTFPNKKNKTDPDYRIGVVSTRWNAEFVEPMAKQVRETLSNAGLTEDNIVLMQVPGAFEIPMAARLMCASQKVDAVVCLGLLIKGETDHYEYIAEAVSKGLMDLQLTLSIPMIYGVLNCRSIEQAEDRSTGDKCHAVEWAKTAMEMAQLRKSQMGGVTAGKKSVGFF